MSCYTEDLFRWVIENPKVPFQENHQVSPSPWLAFSLAHCLCKERNHISCFCQAIVGKLAVLFAHISHFSTNYVINYTWHISGCFNESKIKWKVQLVAYIGDCCCHIFNCNPNSPSFYSLLHHHKFPVWIGARTYWMVWNDMSFPLWAVSWHVQ